MALDMLQAILLAVGSFFKLAIIQFVADLLLYAEFTVFFRLRKYDYLNWFFAPYLSDDPTSYSWVARCCNAFHYYIKMVIYIAQIYAAANRLTSAIFPLSYEHLWTKWRMVIMTLIQIIIPLIIVIPVNFDPSYDIRYAIDSGKIRLFTDAQSTFIVALIDGASSVISTTLSMVCYVITCIGTYRRAHLAAEIRLLASSLLVFGILAFNSLFQVGTILATYCGVREMYMLQDLSYPIVDAIYSCQPWAILISSSIVRQTFFRHLRRKQNKNDIANFSVLMISKVKSTERKMLRAPGGLGTERMKPFRHNYHFAVRAVVLIAVMVIDTWI
ncbi:unnamed protein product, partial [Mesorhabditis spiculigera]